MAGAGNQQTATPNINTASAQALYGAGRGTGQAMGYTPQQVQAGQIATTNLAQYQNPYTQQVIDASAQDVLRNAQLGLNQLCLLYTSPSPRDRTRSRMPSSA